MYIELEQKWKDCQENIEDLNLGFLFSDQQNSTESGMVAESGRMDLKTGSLLLLSTFKYNMVIVSLIIY